MSLLLLIFEKPLYKIRMLQTTLRNRKVSEHSASQKDFRIFLQEELVLRCKKNPKFSMRAFARMLGVENSALSKIIKRVFEPSSALWIWLAIDI